MFQPLDPPHDLTQPQFQPVELPAPHIEGDEQKGLAVRGKQDDLPADRNRARPGDDPVFDDEHAAAAVADRCCLLPPGAQTGAYLNALQRLDFRLLHLVSQQLRILRQGSARGRNRDQFKPIDVHRRRVRVELEAQTCELILLSCWR